MLLTGQAFTLIALIGIILLFELFPIYFVVVTVFKSELQIQQVRGLFVGGVTGQVLDGIAANDQAAVSAVHVGENGAGGDYAFKTFGHLRSPFVAQFTLAALDRQS